MKFFIYFFLAFSTLLSLNGCFSYESRKAPQVVVADPSGVVRETVITTLPRGYRTRVYRGTTYYIYNDRYYRSTPRGYVLVERPW